MTTHLVIRVTADARTPYPKHSAYGPVTKAEALALMEAGYGVLADLGLTTMRGGHEGECITAWRSGSPITWKLLLIELRPPNEDVCEGIT